MRDSSVPMRYDRTGGGHTHAIARYGLEELLPPGVRMVHGRG